MHYGGTTQVECFQKCVFTICGKNNLSQFTTPKLEMRVWYIKIVYKKGFNVSQIITFFFDECAIETTIYIIIILILNYTRYLTPYVYIMV